MSDVLMAVRDARLSVEQDSSLAVIENSPPDAYSPGASGWNKSSLVNVGPSP
jgi:hypothetical protein